jgi:carboxymethylenebutenolidase
MAPFDPKEIFAGGPETERLMKMFASLTADFISSDVAAFLTFLDGEPQARAPYGCTGYCMGGRYSLTMAGLSASVAAAASFHGGNLALDTPDSAHLKAAKSKARIYIAVAGIDQMFDAAEEGRLAAGLREGGADHVIETYKDVHHGFAVSDNPVYSRWASDRHWARLDELFRAQLV